jgi:DNA repair photolyase
MNTSVNEQNQRVLRGRGATMNPANRFVQIHLERDPDFDPAEDIAPGTQVFRDETASIIAYNDSPDVGFSASINPYRGCEHGCIYCYARPTHEYLGFSAGLDFETKIMVKEKAPELLRKELSSRKWRPQCLAISGVTDCYQPIERRFKITRQCLEVLAEFRNPAGIITKNFLVTRDIDVLQELARFNAAAVFVSITSLESSLAQKMEPRTSLPQLRLAAVQKLHDAGIPVGIMCAPMIPGLNDHEMPAILDAAVKAGAQYAGYVPVRLPFAVKDLFEKWIEHHFPERKDKVLGRIRSMRGGKLNDPNFGSRMNGEGPFADQMASLFAVAARKVGLADRRLDLSVDAFRVPASTISQTQKMFPFCT